MAKKTSLGRHLYTPRIERGLSVADVAERTGISQTSIYFWEQGRTRPRDATLATLCKTLKLPIKGDNGDRGRLIGTAREALRPNAAGGTSSALVPKADKSGPMLGSLKLIGTGSSA